MPTVDLDAALSQLFEVFNLYVPENLDHHLNLVALCMAKSDGLFENAELDHGAQERIWQAVTALGAKIKNQLLLLNAYSYGYFPYTFKLLLNDDAILLSYLPVAHAI